MADNVDPDPPPPPAEEDVPAEVVATTPVHGPLPPDTPEPHQGCMAKRSGLEKCLIILVIIIIIICLAFLAFFLIFYFFYSPPEGTCLTEECLESASRLKDYMDDSADPCSDFYEYACGSWQKEQALAPDEEKRGFITMISDANNIKIRQLLEEDIEISDEVFMQKPKKLYKACMNTQLLEEKGKKPLLDLIDKIGDFPALNPAWNETDVDLNKTLIQLVKLAQRPLFTVAVGRDPKDNSKNRITVGAPMLIPPRDDFLEGRQNEAVQLVEKFTVEALVLLGADQQQAEEDAKQMVDFKIELARIMKPREPLQYGANYDQITLPVLQTRYSWLKWREFFEGVARDTKEGTGISIGDEEIILVSDSKYLNDLGNLLKNTPDRVKANVIMESLFTFITALGKDFTELRDKYVEAVTNTKPIPRWEFCVIETATVFPDFVSRMYVDNFFSPEAKQDVVNLIGNLTEVFKGILQSKDWMTSKTKQNALAKLANMQYKIGYPDDLKDNEKLNEKYKSITANEFLFFDTFVEKLRYEVNENINMLREKQDRSKWDVAPISVNAFYYHLTNEITFPAAFLQPPVYSPEYSDSMKFGGLGSYLSRFIAQGFDKQTGSQYDANGELNPWWTDEDRKKFNDRTQCFIDQYGCYKWDGHSIDGELTLNENIADNGGLKTSYQAYVNLLDKRGLEEQRLPGLDLTHRQIFFLSFAQLWCSKTRPELKKFFVRDANHAPAKFRVIGTLQNSKEFAEAYECSPESRMNPGRKCVLW